MPVLYSVVARKNPSNAEAPAKYYAQAKSSGSVSMRQIAKQIAEISTVSTVDTMAVLEAFLQVIPNHIANGNIIRLGEFGSFSLTLKSEGSDTAESVTAANVKGTTLHFRPGKEFQAVLNNITFKKA